MLILWLGLTSCHWVCLAYSAAVASAFPRAWRLCHLLTAHLSFRLSSLSSLLTLSLWSPLPFSFSLWLACPLLIWPLLYVSSRQISSPPSSPQETSWRQFEVRVWSAPVWGFLMSEVFFSPALSGPLKHSGYGGKGALASTREWNKFILFPSLEWWTYEPVIAGGI